MRPRTLAAGSRLVSGLSLTADAGGDQGVSWESCRTGGSCGAVAVGRGAGAGFGPARTLGTADAAVAPALAISPQGQIIVGWLRHGSPVASVGFGAATRLSRTPYATSIAVASGPGRKALAAWGQNTLHPGVSAAAYRG